jgi:hypothetical protein
MARIFNYAKRKLTLNISRVTSRTFKAKSTDFSPLETKYERRLIATMTFCNQTGHLEISNSVITTMPTFAMSIFHLHAWHRIEQIDKYKRQCIWRGADLDSKKPTKADCVTSESQKEKGDWGSLT